MCNEGLNANTHVKQYNSEKTLGICERRTKSLYPTLGIPNIPSQTVGLERTEGERAKNLKL